MGNDEASQYCFESNEGAGIYVNLHAVQGCLPEQNFYRSLDVHKQKVALLNVLFDAEQD